jgi:hypothetical protein
VIDSYPVTPQIAAPVGARLAQTGQLDRPNALPESDTSNKRGQQAIASPKKKEGILDRVKSVFKAADENQPQVLPDDQDAVGKGGQAASKAPRPFHSGGGAAAAGTAAAQQAAAGAAASNASSSARKKQLVNARRARKQRQRGAASSAGNNGAQH